MSTTTGTFVFYQSWLEYMVEGADMDSDVFKVLLTTSTYAPNAATHSAIANITNELAGSGYARQTLSVITAAQVGGVYSFIANDIVFTAAGGAITARYWAMYDDTLAGDPLVAYGLLDATPADVTATDGNTLTVQWDASGLFTIG